jgi:predicted  nucleic acid-binding Zn-ribbon protein
LVGLGLGRLGLGRLGLIGPHCFTGLRSEQLVFFLCLAQAQMMDQASFAALDERNKNAYLLQQVLHLQNEISCDRMVLQNMQNELDGIRMQIQGQQSAIQNLQNEISGDRMLLQGQQSSMQGQQIALQGHIHNLERRVKKLADRTDDMINRIEAGDYNGYPDRMLSDALAVFRTR